MFERINSTRLNRYTTIEKSKARELQLAFIDSFNDELTVAVNNMDLSDTECTDEVIEENNIITTHYAIP